MSKHSFLSFLLIVISFAASAADRGGDGADGCYGEMPNPITDIAWDAIFPISIGSIKIRGQYNKDDAGDDPPLICVCPAPWPRFYRIGIGVGFWEPAKVSEVVRKPMCSPFLGGQMLGDDDDDAPRGTNADNFDGGNDEAFYQVHWYTYPVLEWVMDELLEDLCQYTSEEMDLGFMTEFDSQWNDDEATYVMNTEAVLFANKPAQMACVADAVRATGRTFGIEAMIWCSGSQGSVFPIDGAINNHVGGVDSSLLATHRFVYKAHHMFLEWETGTTAAMCPGAVTSFMLRKTQYKQTMLWPVSNTRKAYGFGAASTIWASGHEYPVSGEDFVYLVWRKRLCCAGD